MARRRTGGLPRARPVPPRRARAIVVVPPLLKSMSGPLLGPALLRAAAEQAGHATEVVDLNAAWLDERVDRLACDGRFLLGGHGKPQPLQETAAEFAAELSRCFEAEPTPGGSNPWMTACASHEQMVDGARCLARGAPGTWIRAQLAQQAPPDVVGVSVLYSGQIPWALAASIVAREAWPTAVVVWGGPHVTALRTEIARDEQYGAFADGFVFGSAEGTFVEILDAVVSGEALPPECVPAGAGRDVRARERLDVVPAFGDLSRYGLPRLALPVQRSRGCAYGRCCFCTYPAFEGNVRRCDPAVLRATIAMASDRGAGLALKDSLVPARGLEDVAAEVGGAVPWDASTKLHRSLTATMLARLAPEAAPPWRSDSRRSRQSPRSSSRSTRISRCTRRSSTRLRPPGCRSS